MKNMEIINEDKELIYTSQELELFDDEESSSLKIMEDNLREENSRNKEEGKEVKTINIFKLQFAISNKFDILITILAYICSILLGCSYNIFELMIGKSINHLIPLIPMDKDYIMIIERDFLTYILLFFITFIVSMLHCFLWYYNGKRLSVKYKKEYLRMILMQDISWFESQNVFELSSKLESQTKSFEAAVN